MMQAPCFATARRNRESMCFQCFNMLASFRPRMRTLEIGEGQHILVSSKLPYETVAKELVHKLKYKDDLLLVDELGDLLSDAVSTIIESKGMHTGVSREKRRGSSCDAPILVPVPLHWKRRYKRGFNQSDLLSRVVARNLSISMSSKTLKRTRATLSQHNLGREERKQNLEGAFVADPSLARGNSIVLIDDILTSGSTIIECARALFKAGAAEVKAAALAHALLESDQFTS